MASIVHSNLDKLSWYRDHQEHSVWDRFNAQEQDQMVADDLLAGRRVSLVLVSLIAAGMILSAVTLAVVLGTS